MQAHEKRAREKHKSEPVKSPYGVGRYCDLAVSPTRSHLLWIQQQKWSKIAHCVCVLWQ